MEDKEQKTMESVQQSESPSPPEPSSEDLKRIVERFQALSDMLAEVDKDGGGPVQQWGLTREHGLLIINAARALTAATKQLEDATAEGALADAALIMAFDHLTCRRGMSDFDETIVAAATVQARARLARQQEERR